MNHAIRCSFVVLALITYLAAGGPAQAQELSCDAGFVTLSRGTIEVSPTGVDDTGNIQCALDVAKANGVPLVRLSDGDFNVSNVQIMDFNGVLEGRSRGKTIVNVIPQSWDCQAIVEGGRVPAAFKFVNGKAQVRTMSIAVDDPCGTAADFNVAVLVHFTGEDALSGCDAGVVHGVVDRIDFLMVQRSDDTAVVATGVSAEGWIDIFSCRQIQFGTFKLNRSRVEGPFSGGLVTGLRASAQVDVNFNEFVNTQTAIYIRNASQLMTIQKNSFLLQTEFGARAVSLVHFPAYIIDPPPKKNRLVIHQNTFTLDNLDESFSVDGISLASGEFVDLSLVVTENDFSLGEGVSFAMFVSDTSGAIVANNRFEGAVRSGVVVATNFRESIENWTITGNAFHKLESPDEPFKANIVLWMGVSNSIVGPDQGASVDDQGTDNVILD
jgi:hypothetical protein